MIISTNWLSEYVKHGLTDKELADHLTMCGLEVDGLETIGSDLSGVVVGHVITRVGHPNADRLSVCTVDIGSGEALQIVCGAPNVAAGQKVAVATIGTTLMLPSRDNPSEKSPVTMKQAKIRGEDSFGMICAADELGLGDDHSGIMVLDASAQVGESFGSYLKQKGTALTDCAIDISITPNRPDAISHMGIARDVAALTRTSVIRPSVTEAVLGGEAAKGISVDIQAPELCARYAAVLVRNVTIGDSPEWMKQRLRAIGLRPRNNIVDITNYVMFECGQPLHAFDYDQVAGHKIIVKATSGPSKFTTLDSKERDLPVGTLMICDGEREVAIAGVMGGENSEVTGATKNVLIESAYFDPAAIRRTAKALQLQTDASYRFERGIDSEGQAWAAQRAADLMVQLAGGQRVDGIVDERPVRFESRKVTLRSSRIPAMVGVDIEPSETVRLLEAIGFGVAESSAQPLAWEITIPSFRPDVEREIDVIEEVARLFGYDNIPLPKHSKIPNFTPSMSNARLFRESTRNVLSGLGFRETYTNSMLSAEIADQFNTASLPAGRFKGEVVHTLNPITTEMSALRPSLLPGMLKVVGHNQNHGQTALRLFEFGRVHTKKKTNLSMVGDYSEIETLLICSSGNWDQQGWYAPAKEVDLFDLKGVVDRVLASAGVQDLRYAASKNAELSNQSVDVFSGKRWLGSLQTVSRAIADQYALRQTTSIAELDWVSVVELASVRAKVRYEAISRFPTVERDLAVLIDSDQGVGPMIEAIQKAGSPLLNSVVVFDVYEGKGVESGKKSVAFGLKLGADRTLRDNEVEKTVAKILESLERDFNAQLR